MHAIATKSQTIGYDYVPWVVANGEHSEEINDAVTTDMLAFVCKQYKGQKAAACDDLEIVDTVAAPAEKCMSDLEESFLDQ